MSGREAAIHLTREAEEMVKVAIEVQSGAARIGVAVQTQSIQRALSLVGGRFPGRNCRVKFPIGAKGFLVEGAAVRSGMVEQPEKLAA